MQHVQVAPPLVDNPNVRVVYADGICGVEIHGTVARITFFELRDDAGRETRMPVLTMIRPIESVITTGLAELVRAAINREKVAPKPAKRGTAH